MIYFGEVGHPNIFYRGVVLLVRFLPGIFPGWIHLDKVFLLAVYIFHCLSKYYSLNLVWQESDLDALSSKPTETYRKCWNNYCFYYFHFKCLGLLVGFVLIFLVNNSTQKAKIIVLKSLKSCFNIREIL